MRNEGRKETYAALVRQRNTVAVKDYTFHDTGARVEIGKAGGRDNPRLPETQGYERIGSMSIGLAN